MAPSPLVNSGTSERSKAVIQLPVDQAGNGTDAGSVGLSVVAIQLGEGLITSQASDGVLDADPRGGKGRVVDDVLAWPWLLAGFATRREAEPGRMERGHPDVGQVTQHPDVRAHTVEESGGFQHREIAGRAADAVGHVDDLAGLGVDRHLGLQRVLLLLPAVVPVRLLLVARALHPLLEGIDDHRQLRDRR